MTLLLKAPFLLLFSLLISLSAQETIFIGNSDSAIRINGNTVKTTAYTIPVGSGVFCVTAYIESWLQKNGDVISHKAQQSGSGIGVSVSQSYTVTLEGWGPGTYNQRSLHRGFNHCTGQWAPYLAGWNGYTDSQPPLVVQRPVLSRDDPPPYFLAGNETNGTYSESVSLVTTPNGAPDSPTFQFIAGSAYGIVSCNNGACKYRATQASSGCQSYEVVLVASYNGFLSNPIWITNNAPSSLEDWGVRDTAVNGGWVSEQRFKVLDRCGNPMNWVQVVEWFNSASYVYPNPTTNWHLPKPFDTQGWDAGVWSGSGSGDSQFDQWGEFSDYMFETDVSGKSPDPVGPGQNSLSEDAASTVTLMDQVFEAATTTKQQGLYIHQNLQYHYLDHGRHKNP